MRGYKNTSGSEENSTLEKGVYPPGESEINFAVPNLNTLRKFVPYEIPVAAENANKPSIL